MKNKTIERWINVKKFIMEANKRVKIRFRKGRFKSFGELENRSFDLEFYDFRDELRGVLYSSIKLLIELHKSDNGEKFIKLYDILINSAFVRFLCIDNTMHSKGALTRGIDGLRGLSDKEIGNLLHCRFETFFDYDYTVKRIWIPKGTEKDLRPIGLSNIKAKVVQELIRILLDPILLYLDSTRAETYNFGFKAGHGSVEAVFQLIERLNVFQPTYICSIDISKCFDSISHESILRELEGLIHPKMIVLVNFMLKGKIYDDIEKKYISPGGVGTPQGSKLSPSLANLVLRTLEVGSKSQYRMIRYADDIIIYGKGSKEVAIKDLKYRLLPHMLKLNEKKTLMFDCNRKDIQAMDFLGYNIRIPKPGGKYKPFIPEKKQAKILNNLKTVAKLCKRKSANKLAESLTPIIRGWSQFYILISRDA
jgi:RNA-directed DNA polymerase